MEVNLALLTTKMAISERQLLRRLKQLCGLSTKQFIQEVKLQKARELLENRAYMTVAEVMYAVGFQTPSYFSKLFKQRFGKSPSSYYSAGN